MLESIDNLDEQTDGVMIHSENFQALNLLQERYKEQVKCIYIDPPYNTNASEIIYKNGYKHSSWISLMSDRLKVSINLQNNRSFTFVAIDDLELFRLNELLEQIYLRDNFIANISVVHKPEGRNQEKFFGTSNEFMLVYAKNKSEANFYKVTLDVASKNKFDLSDDNGIYKRKNFIRLTDGKYALRDSKPDFYYPIYLSKDLSIMDINLFDNAIEVYPVTDFGIERTWKTKSDTFMEYVKAGNIEAILENGKVIIYEKLREDQVIKTHWVKKEYHAYHYGTKLLEECLGTKSFSFPKSIITVTDTLKLATKNCDIILDYFAGSGTTAHAVINLNREDGGKRKYILVEMGEYFNTVTLPRVKKVVYSADWKNGKPTNRESGVSHIMKYFTMESYEDTLQNIELDNNKHDIFKQLGDDYLLNYMLDNETCLLDINTFKNPFAYKLKITEKNESIERKIDMIETFNYLIGLNVINQCKIARLNAAPDPKGEYEGAVKLEPAKNGENGEYAFKCIEGTLRNGQKILIIWRNLTDDRLRDNAALDEFFRKKYEKPSTREFDIIYINGDNTLENLRIDGETWMINLIETEFKKRMFEE